MRRTLNIRFVLLWMIILVLGLFSIQPVFADELSLQEADQNYRRIADPVTSGSWMDFFDSTNSRMSGRVWTDKSVIARTGSTDEILLEDKKDEASGFISRISQQSDGDENRIEIKAFLDEGELTEQIGFEDDFLNIFSALGSTQKVRSLKPVDLMLALDLSGSMGEVDSDTDTTRIFNAVEAINKAFTLVLQSNVSRSHPEYEKQKLNNNRVGLVVYGTIADVFLPLSDYELEQNRYQAFDGVPKENYNQKDYNQYLSVSDTKPYYTFTDLQQVDTSGGHFFLIRSNLSSASYPQGFQKTEYVGNLVEMTPVDDQQSLGIDETNNHFEFGGDKLSKDSLDWTGNLSSCKSVYTSTNMQAGIYAALKQFIDDGQENPGRQPVFMLLSDGGANTISVSQKTLDQQRNYRNGQDYFEPLCEEQMASLIYSYPGNPAREGAQSTPANDYGVVLSTLLSGAYMRQAVENQYSDGTRLLSYGFGIELEALEPWEQFRLEAIMKAQEYFLLENLGSSRFSSSIQEIQNLISRWLDLEPNAISVPHESNGFADYYGFETLTPKQQGSSIFSGFYFGWPEDDPYDIDMEALAENLFVLEADHYSVIGSEDLYEALLEPLDGLIDQTMIPIEGINALNDQKEDSLSYMDPIGEFMEIKALEGLSLFGKCYEIEPDRITQEENRTIYHFRLVDPDGETTLINPNFKEAGPIPLSDISVSIETGSIIIDAFNKRAQQVLRLDLPGLALPVIVNLIESDASGEHFSNDYGDLESSMPLRLYYSVGLQDGSFGILQEFEDFNTGDLFSLSRNQLDPIHISAMEHKDLNGKNYLYQHLDGGILSFYATRYLKNMVAADGTTAAIHDHSALLGGNAVSTFSPGKQNRYYIYQKPLVLYQKAWLLSNDGFELLQGSMARELDQRGLSDGEVIGTIDQKTELPDPGQISFINHFSASNSTKLPENLGAIVLSDPIEAGELESLSDQALCYLAIDFHQSIPYVDQNDGTSIASRIVERTIGDFSRTDLGDNSDLCLYHPQSKAQKKLEESENSEGYVLAAKPGGYRSVNLIEKSQDKKDGLHSQSNPTGTAPTLYIPTVRINPDKSGQPLADQLQVVSFLGNNGKIEMETTGLLISKTVSEGSSDSFDFLLSAAELADQDVGAVIVDEADGSYEEPLSYRIESRMISGHSLVLAKGSNAAMMINLQDSMADDEILAEWNWNTDTTDQNYLIETDNVSLQLLEKDIYGLKEADLLACDENGNLIDSISPVVISFPVFRLEDEPEALSYRSGRKEPVEAGFESLSEIYDQTMHFDDQGTLSFSLKSGQALMITLMSGKEISDFQISEHLVNNNYRFVKASDDQKDLLVQSDNDQDLYSVLSDENALTLSQGKTLRIHFLNERNSEEPAEPKKSELSPGNGALVGLGDLVSYQIAAPVGSDPVDLQIIDPLDEALDFLKASFFENGPVLEEKLLNNFTYGKAKGMEVAAGNQSEADLVILNQTSQAGFELQFFDAEYEPITSTIDQSRFSLNGKTIVPDFENGRYVFENLEENDQIEVFGVEDLFYQIHSDCSVIASSGRLFEPHLVLLGKSLNKAELSLVNMAENSAFILWSEEDADLSIVDDAGNAIAFEKEENSFHFTLDQNQTALIDGLGESAFVLSSEDALIWSNPASIVYDEPAHQVIWNAGVQSGAQTIDVLLEARVNEKMEAAGMIVNQADVLCNGAAKKTNEQINPLVPKRSIPPAGTLLVPGDEIEFDLAWFNPYENPVTISITDVLDEGLEFSGFIEPLESIDLAYDESSHTIRAEIAAQGLEDGVIRFKTTVSGKALEKAMVQNQAGYQIDGQQYLSNKLSFPVLSITKVFEGAELIPQSFSFTLQAASDQDGDPFEVFYDGQQLILSNETAGDNNVLAPFMSEHPFEIRFEKGSWKYQLSERTGEDPDIEYDGSVYDIDFIIDQIARSIGLDGLEFEISDFEIAPVIRINDQDYESMGDLIFTNRLNEEQISPSFEKLEKSPGNHEQVMAEEQIEYSLEFTNGSQDLENFLIIDPVDGKTDLVQAELDGVILSKSQLMESDKTGQKGLIFFESLEDLHEFVLNKELIEPEKIDTEGFIESPSGYLLYWNALLEAKQSVEIVLITKVADGQSGTVINQAFSFWNGSPGFESEIMENPLEIPGIIEETEIQDLSSLHKKETGLNDQSLNLGGNKGPQVSIEDELQYQVEWSNQSGNSCDIDLYDALDPGVELIRAYPAWQDDLVITPENPSAKGEDISLSLESSWLPVQSIKNSQQSHQIIHLHLEDQSDQSSGVLVVEVRVNTKDAGTIYNQALLDLVDEDGQSHVLYSEIIENPLAAIDPIVEDDPQPEDVPQEEEYSLPEEENYSLPQIDLSRPSVTSDPLREVSTSTTESVLDDPKIETASVPAGTWTYEQSEIPENYSRQVSSSVNTGSKTSFKTQLILCVMAFGTLIWIIRVQKRHRQKQ